MRSRLLCAIAKLPLATGVAGGLAMIPKPKVVDALGEDKRWSGDGHGGRQEIRYGSPREETRRSSKKGKCICIYLVL